ncbi:MAG: hypothetical protein ACLP7Q_08570 [Isosphaeraceae bacterium]
MGKPLLPQAFWFRFCTVCPRIDEIPRSSARGGLLDLPEVCTLPDLAALEGRTSWASVRVGWNPQGLGIAVLAVGRAGQATGEPERPEGFADVDFWIDTRDTRNVSRATRFCHRFGAHLTLSRGGKSLDVELTQRAIARALADAPMNASDEVSARANLTRNGWTLEVFLPASTLAGFDPDTNRRLGFAYQVSDHERESQFLGVGRDFPIGENPSLWATLELRP